MPPQAPAAEQALYRLNRQHTTVFQTEDWVDYETDSMIQQGF